MNYLKMTGYIVRTASDNWTLGYEGENNARTLRVKTTDSLTNFATVNLLIDTLDCGAMTIQTVSNYRVLEMVITEEMLGLPGLKTCQLVMKNAAGSVVLKTNQFYMYVKSSNVTDRIYISTEDTIKAALTALINDGVLEDLSIEDGSITTAKIANGAITQAKLDPNISFEADGELDATSTNAVQNKVVAAAIGEVNESLNDLDAETRLDMLVTMQEVIPDEDAPVGTTVQLLDPVAFPIVFKGNKYRVDNPRILYVGDGIYYPNPYQATSSSSVRSPNMGYSVFYDAYGNPLTLRKYDDPEQTEASVSLFTSYGSYLKIEDKRIISTYVRGSERNNHYIVDADIAYFSCPYMANIPSGTSQVGVTYGGYSETYVPYEGSGQETTYEYNYTSDLAAFVQDYISSHERYSNAFYNFTYPERDNSEFINAIKYYHERSTRKNNNVIRIGTFNKFVSRGRNNWETIKQELADYSLDICGFQECAAIVTDGAVSDQIGQSLQGWQFKSYAPQDTVVDKALVSHWNITHTDLITLLTHDGGTVSNCIHALMTISQNKYYSHAVGADATLSVYCYHGASSGKTISGTSYSSYQVRQMEINALLTILAQDTSDFIVIVGDTNAFETGFDIATGTHHEWEMFRNAGFTPVLEGKESTVTADLQNKYFCKADNDKVYCIACYDQIFIGTNITAETYGVVDSNLYPVESLGGVPVSDHCMVYADLKFDFDAVAQSKLADIAVTTPWW